MYPDCFGDVSGDAHVCGVALESQDALPGIIRRNLWRSAISRTESFTYAGAPNAAVDDEITAVL